MSRFTERPNTDGIVIHCSATPPSMDIGRDEIDEWHREKGWNGIGYHYVVRRDGTVEVGRPPWAIGAHAKGHNDTTVAICWVGGVAEDDHDRAEDNRTPEQKEALATLTVGLHLSYQCGPRGHRDYPGVAKACPSFDVASWWAEVREEWRLDERT